MFVRHLPYSLRDGSSELIGQERGNRPPSHERSILPLKRVRTEMRSTVEKEKLIILMLLRTKTDITMEIDYNDIINDFEIIKAQRPLLYKFNDSDTKKNKDI
ncbi:hypothetical protein TNCV_890571 [Trichonephila clavipes]|nr:hypothetical protein TNCV_890571 [Trichonephila clavipes]